MQNKPIAYANAYTYDVIYLIKMRTYVWQTWAEPNWYKSWTNLISQHQLQLKHSQQTVQIQDLKNNTELLAKFVKLYREFVQEFNEIVWIR